MIAALLLMACEPEPEPDCSPHDPGQDCLVAEFCCDDKDCWYQLGGQRFPCRTSLCDGAEVDMMCEACSGETWLALDCPSDHPGEQPITDPTTPHP